MAAYEALTDTVIDLCKGAGGILMAGFRSEDMVINYKSRTDIVTNVDRESEDFIVEGIRSRFNDHSIVAEEGGGRDTGSEYVWYVDPLDATNNFAHGIPFFCVSIGVYSREQRRVVCGAVYDPCHNEMFHAETGCGAFCNGSRLRVSAVSDLGIALLATGFPYAKDDMGKNNLKQFGLFLPNIQCIRRIGSAALDLCYVAAGRIDGYWEPMLKPWDSAAGSLIVQEAGGMVTKYNGSDYDPLFPEILASNSLLHRAMVGVLTSQ